MPTIDLHPLLTRDERGLPAHRKRQIRTERRPLWRAYRNGRLEPRNLQPGPHRSWLEERIGDREERRRIEAVALGIIGKAVGLAISTGGDPRAKAIEAVVSDDLLGFIADDEAGRALAGRLTDAALGVLDDAWADHDG